MQLRYNSPDPTHPLTRPNPGEIANLLCFPSDFTFPPGVTTKQAYRLLGNSISVHVVSLLLRHLLHGNTAPSAS
jgi:site-specific DNA-cytosine methylase